MATCELPYGGFSATFNSLRQDTIQEDYLVKLDSGLLNPYAVLAIAQTTGPDPVPLRGGVYRFSPIGALFADTFSFQTLDETRAEWKITVGYKMPDAGSEQDEQQRIENPLLRPPLLNLEYMTVEQAITQARNVEALSHGDGAGGARAADTLGAVVNACGNDADIPPFDTFQNPVLVVTRNYATLEEISTLNEEYQWTTNSAPAAGYSTRRLKYQLTQSLGLQIEGEYRYFRGSTRVEVRKTTDLIVNNKGYRYWDGADYQWFRDANKRKVAEPQGLALDGTAGGPSDITYRYLDPVSYKPLVGD